MAGVSYARILLVWTLAGCLAIWQTYWQLGVSGGRKNNVTSYLKISLCRNGKLKGEILPQPLAYKPCLDLCCFKE